MSPGNPRAANTLWMTTLHWLIRSTPRTADGDGALVCFSSIGTWADPINIHLAAILGYRCWLKKCSAAVAG
jgi:hypothetical protein